MESVILAFEREKNGLRIRDVIETAGIANCILCHSAAEVKRLVHEQRIGAVICSHKLIDESAELLFSDLPVTCSMLVVAMKSLLDLISDGDIQKLPAPATRGELIAAVRRLLQSSQRAERYIHPRRENEELTLIRQAKVILMDHGMSEEQAHRYLQRESMGSGLKMVQVAQQILNNPVK